MFNTIIVFQILVAFSKEFLTPFRAPDERSIENNSETIIDNYHYFSMKIYVVTPHQNGLSEIVLMMGHKIFFMEKNGKLSVNYPCHIFLSRALLLCRKYV